MSIAVQQVRRASKWIRCDACHQLIYRKRWLRNLHVCPLCQHHGRLTARQRIAGLTDPDSFTELVCDLGLPDPLQFVDTMPYPQRLGQARNSAAEQEAVVCGSATVDGHRAMFAVMDFRFMGGSLGTGTGELITLAAEAALADGVPLIIVSASGGARMQEGVLSLLQMAKISQALDCLREAGRMTISIITDPTYGGVAASFATQADILIAEPGARLGFAGPRVIRDTIGEDLPPGFQTAEFLLTHGLLDLIVDRPRLREVLGQFLSATEVTAVRREDACWSPPDAVPTSSDAWAVVRRARDVERPTTRDYLGYICDWFVELHGDRLGSDSPTVIGGIARIGDRHAIVVGTQKGHTTRELIATNFGMSGPDGYHKAIRLFALAERIGLPVITLIDTPGAYPGIDAERHGQAHTIAASILRLAGLRTPVVSVITGEGGSGGALALAVADRVYMLSDSVYSVISPEGCAAILWTAQDAPRAAAALRLTAGDLDRLGLIDGIIVEPNGGASNDPAATAASLRHTLDEALHALGELTPQNLVARRRRRLRAVGTPRPTAAAQPPQGTPQPGSGEVS